MANGHWLVYQNTNSESKSNEHFVLIKVGLRWSISAAPAELFESIGVDSNWTSLIKIHLLRLLNVKMTFKQSLMISFSSAKEI